MKLEKGIISNSQLAYLVLAFLQNSVLTVSFTFSISKQDTWIAVLAAYGVVLLLTLLYITIARRYPGKNLVEINDAVFGPWVGKVLSALYIWCFFQIIIHHMYFFNSFWITYIMPDTPRHIFLVMFAVICAYAVRGGIELITRLCLSFSIVALVSTVILTVFLIGEIHASYLLPVCATPLMDMIHSTHVITTVPLGDMLMLMMVFPYVADKKRLKKPVFLGLSVAVLQLLIVVMRDIMVLGPSAGNYAAVSFTAARQINIADVLTRMDILVAISLLITVFVKAVFIYYSVVLGTAQLLGLKSYQPLVIPMGALIVAFGVALYPSDMEQLYAAKFVWPFNVTLYEFLLPAATLAAIGIRRLLGRKKELNAQ